MEASDKAKALCADCISRRKLLDKFEPWLKVQDYNDGERNIIKAVLDEIKCMPPGTGNNVATTDCISRQAAIDAVSKACEEWRGIFARCEEKLLALPPAQPDIVRCKDCKYHWTHKCMDSMPMEMCDLGQTFYDVDRDFCSLAERREVTE